MTSPLIRWVGGKSRLLPTLREHLPEGYAHMRHVELFAGSAALFFDSIQGPMAMGTDAILSDVCEPLISTYAAVRSYTPEVLRSLSALQRYKTRKDYERIRARFNAFRPTCVRDEVKRAAMFLYINAVGFNGIWRENASGAVNTPFGEWPAGGIYRRDRIEDVADALRGVHLRAGDALTTAQLAIGRGDFVYLDPPYLPVTAGSFRSYSACGFRLRQHAELARMAEGLAAAGAHVMISNADTWVARELYEGKPWHIHGVKTRTSVAAKGGARGAQAEILITSYPVQRKRAHGSPRGRVAATQGGRRGPASVASSKGK